MPVIFFESILYVFDEQALSLLYFIMYSFIFQVMKEAIWVPYYITVILYGFFKILNELLTTR